MQIKLAILILFWISIYLSTYASEIRIGVLWYFFAPLEKSVLNKIEICNLPRETKLKMGQKLKIRPKIENGTKLKIGQNWKKDRDFFLLTALSSSVNNVVCWLINILVEILDVYNLSRKYWTFSMYFGCLWWPFREPSLMALFFISITASAINMTVFVCLSRTRIKASAKSRRTLGSLGLDFSKAKTSRKLWA